MSGKGKGGRGKGKTGKGESTSTASKAGLQFPCARLTRYLRGRVERTSMSSGVYMGAVLEYLCAEILELAGPPAARVFSRGPIALGSGPLGRDVASRHSWARRERAASRRVRPGAPSGAKPRGAPFGQNVARLGIG